MYSNFKNICRTINSWSLRKYYLHPDQRPINSGSLRKCYLDPNLRPLNSGSLRKCYLDPNLRPLNSGSLRKCYLDPNPRPLNSSFLRKCYLDPDLFFIPGFAQDGDCAGDHHDVLLACNKISGIAGSWVRIICWIRN
jgi:hypothetical protein